MGTAVSLSNCTHYGSSSMKIKIETTVNVDPEIIRAYQAELGCSDETIREFVRSWIISGGVGSLEESLMNNGFDHTAVEVVA